MTQPAGDPRKGDSMKASRFHNTASREVQPAPEPGGTFVAGAEGAVHRLPEAAELEHADPAVRSRARAELDAAERGADALDAEQKAAAATPAAQGSGRRASRSGE